MPVSRPSPLRLGTLLEAVEAAPPIAGADVVGLAVIEALGAREVSFLIADYSGQSVTTVCHVWHPDDAGAAVILDRVVPQHDTPHGRALAEQETQVSHDARGWLVFAPVTSRGEAIGVLEVLLRAEPDERTRESIATAAHALAYVVIANRRFTDVFEQGQRTVPLSVGAEIQHRLLPGSYTCEGGQFTLAGWLEPAGEVAGDTFDYSVERETLHLSMTDAMGHTLDAAVLATVFVGALRNARRQQASLADQAHLADVALAEFAQGEAFVTGQLLRIDLPSGTARIVNAGHPLPVRIRDGAAEEIALHADPPFGTRIADAYRVQDIALMAGDRVMFLTDGMLERNAATVDVHHLLVATRELHPREAVQELTRAVLAACGGTLRDDATVLCLDWHGGPPRDRETTAGADDD